jgi:hypothetical protein
VHPVRLDGPFRQRQRRLQTTLTLSDLRGKQQRMPGVRLVGQPALLHHRDQLGSGPKRIINIKRGVTDRIKIVDGQRLIRQTARDTLPRHTAPATQPTSRVSYTQSPDHGICARTISGVRLQGALKTIGQDFVLTLDSASA